MWKKLLAVGSCLVFGVACGNPAVTSVDGGGGGSVQLIGAAQKGPFSIGSTVQLSLLDAQANPTGVVFNATTRSDLGDFELMLPQGGPIEIATTGYYFNELTGVLSTSQITLRAVVELTDAPTQTVYVNALTQLSYLRAKKLVAAGATLSAAVKQAESELVTALPLFRSASTIAGSSLNLLGDDSEDNAYLFALSCLLGQGAEDGAPQSVDAKLQELVSMIALDLEDDGALNIANGTLLTSARDRLDSGRCTANFAAWRSKRGITTPMPQIGRALDWDRDGLSDFADGDDDGDGLVEANDKAVEVGGDGVIDSGGQYWDVAGTPRLVTLPGKAQQVVRILPGATEESVVLLDNGRVFRVPAKSEPIEVAGLSGIVWIRGGTKGLTAVDATGKGWWVNDQSPGFDVVSVEEFSDLKAVCRLSGGYWVFLREDGSIWLADQMGELLQVQGLPKVTEIGMYNFGDEALLGEDGTVWIAPFGFSGLMNGLGLESVASNVRALSKDGGYAIHHDGTVSKLNSDGSSLLPGISNAVAVSGFVSPVRIALTDGSVVSIADPFATTPDVRTVGIPR